MFRPHYGVCIKCKKDRLIVVRAGYCGICNEAKKKADKASRPRIQKHIKLLDTKVKLKDKIKELDDVFSYYLRCLHADADGIVTCYTCGDKGYPKDLQCGHYVTRAKYPTRWMVENCKPQCYHCNVRKNGNYTVFAQKMLEENGPDFMRMLEIKKNNTMKLSVGLLQILIDDFVQKTKELSNA